MLQSESLSLGFLKFFQIIHLDLPEIFPLPARRGRVSHPWIKKSLAFVCIPSAHHKSFKLCNSNLEGSICHCAAIHPSDEGRFFIDFPSREVFRVLVDEERQNEGEFLRRAKHFPIAPWMLRRKPILDGFRAFGDHSTSDREKAKFSWINFQQTFEQCTFRVCKSRNHPSGLFLQLKVLGRSEKSIFNAIN